MSVFSFRTRGGWRDGNGQDVPALAAQYFRTQEAQGSPLSPRLLASFWDVAGKPIHRASETDLERPGGASLVFDDVGWFLKELRNPEVVKAELIFMNSKAMKPTHHVHGKTADRPPAFEESETLAAVERFVNAVADSLHPSGTHGEWASCEWAALEITVGASETVEN